MSCPRRTASLTRWPAWPTAPGAAASSVVSFENRFSIGTRGVSGPERKRVFSIACAMLVSGCSRRSAMKAFQVSR